ncbi:MAG: DUF3883 domain-containing protein [Vicinamibacteria bacterium]|nr:DUF3883 domain-containing protein [Vicinamibacteria bacterium]
MPDDWSREEVEATVADYFEMFEAELRGDDYIKAVHRRGLARVLKARSEASIEFKHQNISAVLVDLGAFYIEGYKPRFNYQQILFECVSDRLANSPALSALVRERVSQPATVPDVEDILAAWVDPPVPDPDRDRFRRTVAAEGRPPRAGVDYAAVEASNRSLGAAGEEFVVRFEVARLIRAGRESLAKRVERVSETRGDGLGFDILSFEESGQDRLIEVKTTAYGQLTPFFVTRNEVAVSQAERDRFHLYRAYNFRKAPRLFSRPGPLEHSFRLDPSLYEATV